MCVQVSQHIHWGFSGWISIFAASENMLLGKLDTKSTRRVNRLHTNKNAQTYYINIYGQFDPIKKSIFFRFGVAR